MNSQPIIIFGNQKSGTSAIAALLGRCVHASVTIDIPDLWEPTMSQLIRRQIRFADVVNRNRLAFSRAIIKEPNLTFIMDEVIEYFPSARYVMVVRDPRHNIRSILDRVKCPGDLPQLPLSLLHAHRCDWKNVVTGSTIDHAGANYIETLALRWNVAIGHYLRHAHRIQMVKYEEFNSAKKNSIELLAHKLEMPIKDDITVATNIPFQPRGNNTVASIDFFGENNLRRIETICEQYMLRLGYES